MKNNEDIGALFEKKLHGVERTPSESLWDRVDATLNKKNKRRKRIFWYWMGGATFLLIFALLYAVVPFSMINDNSEKQTIELTTDSDVQKKASEEEPTRNEKSDVELKPIDEGNSKENLTTETASKELLSEKNRMKENSSENEKTGTPIKKRKATSSEKNRSNNKMADDGYEVKTNYYYYNGENDEHIKTSDKNTIDSLLNNTENQIDEVGLDKNNLLEVVKKRDSLNR